MKKLNNKGYMLVEIILAFAIAFAILYFMMDLVLNVKNKNDDLLVETVVKTDQTIILNKLMDYAILEEKDFDCNLLKNGITEKSIKYGDDVLDIIDDRAVIDVDKFSCSVDYGKVSIKIPIEVEQMKDEDFDVIIDYKYDLGDMIAPSCSLSAKSGSTTITATYSDNSGSVSYYGWSSSYSGENSTTKTVSSTETLTYYVKDASGNTGTCSATIKSTSKDCPSGYYESTSGVHDCYKSVPEYNCYYNCGSEEGSLQKSCKTITKPSSAGCACTACNSQGSKFAGSGPAGTYKVTGYEDFVYKCSSGYTKLSDKYCFKAN